MIWSSLTAGLTCSASSTSAGLLTCGDAGSQQNRNLTQDVSQGFRGWELGNMKQGVPGRGGRAAPWGGQATSCTCGNSAKGKPACLRKRAILPSACLSWPGSPP